jgi:hypothetical protein
MRRAALRNWRKVEVPGHAAEVRAAVTAGHGHDVAASLAEVGAVMAGARRRGGEELSRPTMPVSAPANAPHMCRNVRHGVHGCSAKRHVALTLSRASPRRSQKR